METNFSFKDFEQVTLKATYDMTVGNRKIEAGEIIAFFDKIQIARLIEEVDRVSANGGFDNRAHVFWTTTKDQVINFAQGVFSKTQFSLLINSRLVELVDTLSFPITEHEELESDEEGKITLKHTPSGKIWIYDKATGNKIINFTCEGDEITLENPFVEVIINYSYNYSSGAQVYCIGQQLTNGFLELEGRTRVKDDKSGRIVTGIFKIPKLKLMSNLSISLGTQASPVVGNFSAIAVPVGSRGTSYVSEFYILNDDIESDL